MANRIRDTGRSYLDMTIINGRPLRDVTIAEARQWCEQNERNCRFVRILIAAMPADGTIGDYFDIDKINRLLRDRQNQPLAF